ncbi:KinB-signaling pathway activation protein [Tumebacillus permanentifrigoris]|uniref:KinB signaling pathway activation protein n=1 Tax=Tumebacillus permanentifrigoris TaxID=378543 RepID=A0A316D3P7_9BACL|nr:KinB-signaling pathway activation protein [Tumebacillus permanentifrigoris]PWK05709.1 KinB signaling pathway activation protein [Tumebacillus permanentifrigoris]
MNLRKFFTLFFSTALVGLILGGITTATGLFDVSPVFGTLLGGFLSATTLMGFWAYLTLNFTMRSFISFRIWVWIQVLLIALVVYDLIYFRWLSVAGGEGSLLPFIGYALWPLAAALVGAYFKGRLSGMRSFIPSVFYLYVFTSLEWFVALKSGAITQMTQVGIILLACNVYILFMYTRLLTKQQPSPAR